MRPDYLLKAVDKNTKTEGLVGAGWSKEDGTIQIRINICVRLVPAANLVYTLHPVVPSPEYRE